MLQLAAVNYYYKALHLGCCSSPRSASVNKSEITHNFFSVAVFLLCFCCCCHCFCFWKFFFYLATFQSRGTIWKSFSVWDFRNYSKFSRLFIQVICWNLKGRENVIFTRFFLMIMLNSPLNIKTQYVLLDRIEQEYFSYCSDLVLNTCFVISHPQKYHIWFKKDRAV